MAVGWKYWAIALPETIMGNILRYNKKTGFILLQFCLNSSFLFPAVGLLDTYPRFSVIENAINSSPYWYLSPRQCPHPAQP